MDKSLCSGKNYKSCTTLPHVVVYKNHDEKFDGSAKKRCLQFDQNYIKQA